MCFNLKTFNTYLICIIFISIYNAYECSCKVNGVAVNRNVIVEPESKKEYIVNKITNDIRKKYDNEISKANTKKYNKMYNEINEELKKLNDERNMDIKGIQKEDASLESLNTQDNNVKYINLIRSRLN